MRRKGSRTATDNVHLCLITGSELHIAYVLADILNCLKIHLLLEETGDKNGFMKEGWSRKDQLSCNPYQLNWASSIVHHVYDNVIL